MSDSVVNRAGGNATVYDIVVGMNLATGKPAVGSITQKAGSAPVFTGDSEIVIRLFWDQVGGGEFQTQADTADVAQAVEAFISEASGLAHPLAELPIHLIGHSRGASVMSELARIFGQKGIWVHQLTFLDPHPVRPSDFPNGNDAEVRVWETVLFADNYYERILQTFPDGEEINGADNANLTFRLPGGYGDGAGPANHSDVHLWYHGTVDTGAGAYDGQEYVTGTMRNAWYLPDEYAGQKAGFYYSRLGGGQWALDGFLFGYNDGGHNILPDTRVNLSRNANEWPSLISLIQNASGSIQAGNAFPVEFIYQSYDSGASVTLYLDTDQNPYNGNEIALTLPAINPQPSTARTTKVVEVNGTVPASAASSSYHVYGKITNPYGTRYLYAARKVQIVTPTTAASATITSVSPTTLPTSASPQLINIYGSNFKPAGDAKFSMLIFRDPNNTVYVRTPVYVSASQLQYNINIPTAVGTWSVIVTNAGQPASNTKTFESVTPPPNTGSLTVNLSPSGAVTAGAQWRVDGGSYRNDGDTVTGLTPGSHTVSFKSVPGYDKPSAKTVSITAGANTPATGNYSVEEPDTYTLNLSASNGHITPRPDLNEYPAGTEVRLTAYPDDGYVFDDWDGDANGTDRTIYITMDSDKSITADFDLDTSIGHILVNLAPPQAVAEGAQWKYRNYTAWQNSGYLLDYIPTGDGYVHFKDIPGWITPDEIESTVVGGQTTTVNATYQEVPGTVQVTIEPAAANTAGARWRLDGAGAWQTSLANITGVTPGVHQIEFQSIPGWTTPAPQSITVQRGGNAIAFGHYGPPPGLPLINLVSPKTGPIEGGTLLTIEGANFSANAAVFVRGQAASNITFVNATRLTAVTPPSQAFGSAEVVVDNGTSKATNANAFAYGIPLGTNMTLITSSGGTYQAVACNDQHLFIGQGTTFLVYNIANPASPVFVSSVAIPGLVRDIAMNGNFAIIAAGDAGAQVVDISNPAAPRLRGFYDTAGTAYGISVLANRAYVADGNNGLLILDVTNPDGPFELGSLNLGSICYDIALTSSGNEAHAFLSAQGQMLVLDVANPTAPTKIGEVGVGGNNWSIAIAGNLAFLGRLGNGVNVVDISNATNVVSLGEYLQNNFYVTVASSGNRVVLSGFGPESFQVIDVSGTDRTLRGAANVDTSFDSGPYGATVRSNIAWLAGGLAVFGVDISNPDSPQLIFERDSQGSRFEKVASLDSNIASATPEDVFAFNYSDNTLVQTESFDAGGQSGAFFFYGDTLYNVHANGFERYQKQANGNFTQLVPLTIPNVWLADAHPSERRLLSVSSAKSDGHAVISEHDPSGANWILRQKDLPFRGGGDQIAGADEFFVVGCFDSSLGGWILAGYDWNATDPTWQISGLERIYSLQLSHTNRFLHVGENRAYRIYDLMASPSPAPLSTNSTTSNIREIAISDNFAYVAASAQGVLVYDVTDKAQPRLARSYDTPGSALGLTLKGDRLVVSDRDAGIQVLGLPDITTPQISITNPVASEFETMNSPITLGGTSQDDSGQIAQVIWANDRGGGGVAIGTNVWSVTNVVLQAGTNVLTVTAFDQAGNASSDTLTVIYDSPKQSQSITFPALTSRTFGEAPFTVAATASSGLPIGFSIFSGPASMSNNIVTLTGAGVVTVRAEQSGDANFNAALAADRSFTVSKAEQLIAFTAPEDVTFGDPPISMNATASSGLPLAFEIVSGPATVSSNVVTLTGPGAVFIRVSQPGDSNYHAAPEVERSFVVAKMPQFIVFGALSRQVLGDAPFPLTASASSGLPVSFSVLAGAAVVSGNVLTITGAGLVVLRASQPGNATYAPASNVDQVLNVAPGNNVITDAQQLENGMFTLRFYGEPGTSYVVQASTNLVHWQPVATNQVSGLGYLEFTDTVSTNYDRRFYRVAP